MDWISVNERLPEEHKKVLIFPTSYEPTEYSRYGVQLWALFYNPYGEGYEPKFYAYDYSDDCYCEMKELPTHWQPLPQPPKP